MLYCHPEEMAELLAGNKGHRQCTESLMLPNVSFGKGEESEMNHWSQVASHTDF